MTEKQTNNPLHGLKNEQLLTELVEFYGWDILYEALRLACFKNNPSVASSVKFIKKTEWAKDKVENFYLYRFKRMPRPSKQQFALKPRERGFADGIEPRAPQPLTPELIAEMKQKAQQDYELQQQKKRQRQDKPVRRGKPSRSTPRQGEQQDPWSSWKTK
ncbi:VF530 family DNA-binding protein [Motilimonas eburnea]|uniref:VF530 family protein n=1 Tax=Motilimonas eburnea TaxID=1737488 RepID=UPI001E4BBD38|nr:VF530 family DNA-binding protein [Motilimonas eburnea]MCE2573445.1 VF530 family DNA-binding protein [Motilimonas eburnea]